MATHEYNYTPHYPQRHMSDSGGSQSRPPPSLHRSSVSSFGGATKYTPAAAPLYPMQNSPYYPPQQTTLPGPDYHPQQPVASYRPPPQAFQQVARTPHQQQLAYFVPPSHEQLAYHPAAPEPFVGASLHPSSAYGYDQYETVLDPRDGRRRSSSSGHSRCSRHSSYRDDSGSDYSNCSGRRRDHRAHRKEKKKQAEVAALDRKPSFGDSVLLVYDVLKGAITGKRN